MRLPFVIVSREYLAKSEKDRITAEAELAREKRRTVELDGWNRRLAGEAQPLRDRIVELEQRVQQLEQEFRDLPRELARPRAKVQELTQQLADARNEIARLERAANPAPPTSLPPGAPDTTLAMTKVSPIGSPYWLTQKQVAAEAAHRQSA